MSRVRVDTQPSIIVRPHLDGPAAAAEVEGVANAVAALVRVSVVPQLSQVPGLSSDQCGIEIKLEDEFRCGHCNSAWTGASADFNRGCCGADEANDPERLVSIRQAAKDIRSVAFYAVDENGQRSDAPISWPNTLAGVAIHWLDVGRPDGWACLLLFGVKRVRDCEWRSLRTDALGLRDRRPDSLGCALLELMDDMGLLTASARTRSVR
jgi:hypothetical protein